MAILKGIKVTIVVNGQDLHEYDDEDAGSNTQSSVSKYIEATSGAEFQIKSSAPKSYKFTSDAVNMDICLDGIEVEATLFRKARAKPDHAWNTVLRGTRRYGSTGWECRPFTFAELVLVEEASDSKQPRVADLGTITITFTRTKVLGLAANRLLRDPGMLQDAPKLAEKELKGKNVTHAAKLGKVQTCETITHYRTAPMNSKEPPIAIFKFNYRSRKALQGLLLIPRTPSPPRSPTPVPLEERDIDSLTPEEMRELSRRQQARYRMEREANAKNEGGSNAEHGIKTERGFKRERDQEYDNLMASASKKKARTRPFTNGEVVELDD